MIFPRGIKRKRLTRRRTEPPVRLSVGAPVSSCGFFMVRGGRWSWRWDKTMRSTPILMLALVESISCSAHAASFARWKGYPTKDEVYTFELYSGPEDGWDSAKQDTPPLPPGKARQLAAEFVSKVTLRADMQEWRLRPRPPTVWSPAGGGGRTTPESPLFPGPKRGLEARTGGWFGPGAQREHTAPGELRQPPTGMAPGRGRFHGAGGARPGGGRGKGCPPRHRATRTSSPPQCGHWERCGTLVAGCPSGSAGAWRSASGSAGAGGCHAACSAALSTGAWRHRARTRLSFLRPPGCSQPKRRTR